MQTTKQTAAQMIRKELKEKFPTTKFSVRKRYYGTIDVNWVDGPSSDQIKDITCKYQYGHFDGMTDMYENSNINDNLPQVKYVFEDRELSEEVKVQAHKDLLVKWAELIKNNDRNTYDPAIHSINPYCHTVNELINVSLRKVDLTDGYSKVLLGA